MSHIAISQPMLNIELKVSMDTKFDILILDLNSYVPYKIVMTSVWHNIRKISETTNFVGSTHIYWYKSKVFER